MSKSAQTSVKEWIQSWVAARRRDDSIELQPDTDLYKAGLLDSLGVIELIEALEDHHGIMFTEEEMRSGLTNVNDFERIIAAHK